MEVFPFNIPVTHFLGDEYAEKKMVYSEELNMPPENEQDYDNILHPSGKGIRYVKQCVHGKRTDGYIVHMCLKCNKVYGSEE